MLGRERLDSINAMKKNPGNHLNDHNQGFESPKMSPMLNGTGFNSINYGGFSQMNMGSSNFQNILL